tara:strand:+ start:248 stop:403 length:156 start_codon:yes stop_codon:yes gene_type:complete
MVTEIKKFQKKLDKIRVKKKIVLCNAVSARERRECTASSAVDGVIVELPPL